MLAPTDASRNGRYKVGRDGCSPHRMLLGTGRYQVGRHGCAPHQMLLGTGRYRVGSDGCSPHRMLLQTGCRAARGGLAGTGRGGWVRGAAAAEPRKEARVRARIGLLCTGTGTSACTGLEIQVNQDRLGVPKKYPIYPPFGYSKYT